MNIQLVPFTWARHLALPLYVASAALLAWWVMVSWVAGLNYTMWERGYDLWTPEFEGAVLFGIVTFAIAFALVFAEGSLRRISMVWRLFFATSAGSGAFLFSVIFYLINLAILGALGERPGWEHVADSSLVTLRHRIMVWVFAGIGCGLGPLIVRRGQMLFDRLQKYFEIDFIPEPPQNKNSLLYDTFTHLIGGMVAGMWGGAMWQLMGYKLNSDLYYASMAGMVTMGFVAGALIWEIPRELYTGWVRVLSSRRYGKRIPIDSPGKNQSERFLGHFPRGVDLHLPVANGVAELHASFLVDEEQRYAVRGLSVAPTLVKRTLEKIDLRYDPRRPAPLETTLKMEDRVVMQTKDGEAEVEFLLLPKEER